MRFIGAHVGLRVAQAWPCRWSAVLVVFAPRLDGRHVFQDVFDKVLWPLSDGRSMVADDRGIDASSRHGGVAGVLSRDRPRGGSAALPRPPAAPLQFRQQRRHRSHQEDGSRDHISRCRNHGLIR